MPSKVNITDEELGILAKTLLLKQRVNIYSLCLTLFKKEASDQTFDDLKEKQKVFKCEHCDRWLPITEQVQEYDQCEECAND